MGLGEVKCLDHSSLKMMKVNTVTINGERYRDMMSTQLWPKLEDTNVDNFWFQQDGATYHTWRQTLAILPERFPQTEIVKHGGQGHQDY